MAAISPLANVSKNDTYNREPKFDGMKLDYYSSYKVDLHKALFRNLNIWKDLFVNLYLTHTNKPTENI